MPDKTDWILRPVARGWCKYESIKDGTLNIMDFAHMNDGITVYDENMRRANTKRDS